MKTLKLIIKQKYFDEIVAGTKKQEFREVTQSNFKKFVQIDEEGYELVDENENGIPVLYDRILFMAGYSTNRDTALVEVKDIHTEIFIDEDGHPIQYEIPNPKTGKSDYWIEEQVVYDLGQIIEVNRNKKQIQL